MKGQPSPTAKAFLAWVAGIVAAVLVTIVGGALLSPTLDFFGIAQPDIRYTLAQVPDLFTVLDQRHGLDENGNAVSLVSVRLRVKNVAMKGGHIERAEFVPFTIGTLPKIEVQGIERRDIRWGEEMVVEVRALVRWPVETVGPANERKTLETEIRLFDNAGHQVGRFVNGDLARMRLKTAIDIGRK